MAKMHMLSASEVVSQVQAGELSVKEYVSSILEHIHQVETEIHAFNTVLELQALSVAEAIDKKARKGKRLGALSGVTIALKDNLCMDGTPTTCSSRMLQTFKPTYDATVVKRLKEEDAVIVGKTNMDEFAMGTTTETSYFGPTRNPLIQDYVAGGSSGGSAAAVASKEVPLALGSDTGGSVRCPASFCGVVGLKPTYGLVSRYGLIAYANSLDQIGPISRDVDDCALLLKVIAGNDPSDSTSAKQHRCHLELAEGLVEGLEIGLPNQFFEKGIDPQVESQVRQGISHLEELGASCHEVSLPSLEYALATYYIIAMSEASSNLARYDGLRYGYNDLQKNDNWKNFFSRNRGLGFGPEVKRRIILGTYALSAGYYDRYYYKALQVRTLIRRDFERAFENCDILIGPTMPVLPFKIGDRIDDPLAVYMCDVLTVPANLVGSPAISLPCGQVKGLPVGLQAIAPFFGEEKLLRIGRALEIKWRTS